jgi:F-type H+-transporting ATPase subunit delta
LNGAVSSRYAAALTDVALKHDAGERIKADLASFVEAFAASADLRNVLETPAVGYEAKQNVIHKLAERMELVPEVRNFIQLLVLHRRTDLVREIQQAFESDLNARMGIAEAEVKSARELNAKEKEQLTAALEQRTGKKIQARFSEDRSLLGGLVVRVGSTIYDGSVREQLTRLRQKLEEE